MSKSSYTLILKGAAMGVAEVIPGVSGGTIAFITGIYERLINCIKAFGPIAINGYREGGVKGFWKAIDGNFLVLLLSGMAVGFLIGIFAVSYLLEAYPEPLWAFFFGLIVASAIYIGKQISIWDFKKVLALIIGIAIAYTITVLSPAEGNLNPFYVFISGMIAISALLLPGISGSFILLLMGMYTIIMPTIKHFLTHQDLASLIIISIFAMGCLVGLVGFSRILSWLFDRYEELGFALLTGFLIGALNKVWPWRNVQQILNKDTGEILEVLDVANFKNLDMDRIKILYEVNVLPGDYMMDTPKVIASIIALIAGFIIVFFFETKSN